MGCNNNGQEPRGPGGRKQLPRVKYKSTLACICPWYYTHQAAEGGGVGKLKR